MRSVFAERISCEPARNTRSCSAQGRGSKAAKGDEQVKEHLGEVGF